MQEARDTARVLMIGEADLHGSRFGGMRLTEALRKIGLQVELRVWRKTSREPSIRPLCSGLERFLVRVAIRMESILSLQSILSPLAITLPFRSYYRRAGIVHLQIVHTGYFSLLVLPLMALRRQVVWTLHDPWALTGHCVHPRMAGCDRWMVGCGKCPNLDVLFPIRVDTTRFLYLLKKTVLRQTPLTVLVASDFMESMVRRSRVFARAKVERIRFGIDLERFRPVDKAVAKRVLGIPTSHWVIAFRSTKVEFKGLEHILALLRELPADHNVTILTFNDRNLVSEFRGKFNIVELGWVDDEEALAMAYCASDVFVMPSRAESFGFMAIESMACGTPVIAFDHTALTETLDHGRAGILLAEGDTGGMVRAITKLRSDPGYGAAIAAEALALVRRRHDQVDYHGAVAALYRRLGASGQSQ